MGIISVTAVAYLHYFPIHNLLSYSGEAEAKSWIAIQQNSLKSKHLKTKHLLFSVDIESFGCKCSFVWNSPCWAWAPCWGLLRCLTQASGWLRTQQPCPVEWKCSDQRRRRSARRRCPAHCAESDVWASTCSCQPWARGKWCCPLRCAGDWHSATGWAGRPSRASRTGRNPSPSQKTEACSWRSWAGPGPGPLSNWAWSNLVEKKRRNKKIISANCKVVQVKTKNLSKTSQISSGYGKGRHFYL